MNNRRQIIWAGIEQEWDLLIVGGGITGAGILREASRAGLRALLVEQKDFAWGTSSRSSKLVHGGLRYLKEGKLGLTLASVQERQHLLADGPGLIDPLGFLLASYEGDIPGRLVYRALATRPMGSEAPPKRPPPDSWFHRTGFWYGLVQLDSALRSSFFG